jgi:hypothetical protein
MDFYDSIDPSAIPRGSNVAGYYDGEFAWTTTEVGNFPGHILLSTLSNQAQHAEHARALDVERFDATILDVVPFLLARIRFGRSDGTIYCNRESQPSVRRVIALDSRLILGHNCRLWVATLDGTLGLPDMTGVWAIQYKGGVTSRYDTSRLIGKDDFTRAN